MEINNKALVQDTQNLIGQSDTLETADILVDKNGDGIVDTKWIVKTDGTKTEEPFTP